MGRSGSKGVGALVATIGLVASLVVAPAGASAQQAAPPPAPPPAEVVCDGERLDRFGDVGADNVHADAIGCAAALAIVNGFADGAFGPALAATRGQTATIIRRALGEVGVELPGAPPDAFDDDAGSVHEVPINQLADLGVMQGKGGRTFEPGAMVRRDQLAAIVVRAHALVTGDEGEATEDHFADDGDSVHEGDINRAFVLGLTSGRTATTFEPDGDVRRDQIAAFTVRLLAALDGEGFTVVEPACDPLDPRACLLPFPNDAFTVADPTSATGRRVDFDRRSMPANASGVHIDPTEWNRQDGFSPGAPLMVQVPGIDLAATGAAPIGDLESSLAPDAPIVLLDAETGERHPYWAELDAGATTPADQLVFIRPATNFLGGHRYGVGLRDLRGEGGAELAPSAEFVALRDATGDDVPAERRARYDTIFDDLEGAGVARSELHLAWDFTIASAENLAGRLLHIRDDAFADLDGAGPEFTVTSVEADDGPLATRISGTFQVPSYLTSDGQPGTRFNHGPDGLPEDTGRELTANFACGVPPSATAADPARLSLYGHGLLGSHTEVFAGNVRAMSAEHNFVFCATDWRGFARADIGNAVAALGDLSRFPTVADRSQQGILDMLLLGRLMIHAEGLASDPAFQDAAGAPLIDTAQLSYDGNSQGGIMGGALVAVATDLTRAVLGVPGMNYSTLLDRSVDFDPFATIYDPAYPDQVEGQLGVALIQMLWDRFEANGYAQHLTDEPLPGTPAHQVLMHVAFGDHQVANISAEVMARTIGANAHRPALAPGRHWGNEPIWDVPAATDGSTTESVFVYWDSGTPTPPDANVPPRPPAFGEDPHEDPRADADARRQKAAFLAPEGRYVDVCGGQPCAALPVE